MEGGALFNSGFLGASFNWWIGQIADDSTWRDNILPGKFENASLIPGWGRRYKVRIIGLHDQGETEIKSDQLPWAQVMYPITAGGGQGGSGQTPNLRQGNMVFGFFLDGQEQQVPVIMGVLGNNAQTQLATKIGDGKVTNTQPGSLATSGFAEGQVPISGPAKPTSPDTALVVASPGGASSTGPAKAGATIENPDAIHLANNRDTKALDQYLKKTVMLSPCDPVGSAMKAMQTEIENLTKEIDKVLQAAQSYVDAVSQVASQISNVAGQIGDIVKSDCPSDAIGAAVDVAGDIQALLEQYAPKLATHTKVIMDKVGEYTSKTFNAEIAPLADVMFPNQRFQFLDMKIEINETFKCLFSGITDGLSDSILGALTDSLDLCNPSKDATDAVPAEDIPAFPGTAPFVPICSVEKLVGDVIATNLTDIEQTVEDALSSVGTFMNDIQSGLAELTGLIGGIKIPDINASIASALSFENITLDIFGCDLKPNCAASDFYTLQEGGGAAEEAQLPSASGLAEEAAKGGELRKPPTIPFATPRMDYDKTEDLLSAENTRLQGNETSGSFNPGGAASGGTLAE
jgi:uncharacterized protein YoxC